MLRSLKSSYLAADPRSLGLFRIGFGLLLMADLLHRYGQLDLWYTNTGLLPNHTLLWRPPSNHVFSLFFVASSGSEACVGFALCAIVYVLFIAGYRTRWVQAAALVCRISLNSRLAVLENGGDMVMNLLCIFSLALPLGRRFSIDAWLGSLREVTPRTAAEWNQPPPREREIRPVYSLAMLGLILQFALIYFFNAISKQGDAWIHGTAVHYALHQDKFVTPLGLWMREHVPAHVLRYLTWSVLTTEWLGFALIITPLFTNAARLIAVLVLPLLHLSFALGLDLGMFSPAMISFFPLLLRRAHWDAIARWLERRSAACSLEFDADDPRLRAAARTLRELDRFGRIEFRPVSQRGWHGSIATLLSALPWGFLLALPLRLPGVGALCRFLASWAGRERTRTAVDAPTSRSTRWLANLALIGLMAALATEIVNENASVPAWMKWSRSDWSTAVIEYPRLLQGWRMFAPDPPLTDSMIYVDATTGSGKHVDPYNRAASRYEFPAADVVPARLSQSQFFTMYSDRISLPYYTAYHQALLEWLLAYPKRTGVASDCLVALEVYLVTDRSPDPGGNGQPTPVSRQKIMQYTAPASGDCKKTDQDSELHVAQNKSP